MLRWPSLPPVRRASKTWRRGAGLLVTLSAPLLAASLMAAPAQAATTLTLLSTDPYTDTFSAHKTEVEPSALANGSTIVSAFQVSRVFIGASANIGFATSVNGGKTWIHGFLPNTTINATPPGPYARASDASVAFDARDHQWLISFLMTRSITSNAVVDVLVSRSNNGIAWSKPIVISARNEFLDKNWTTCDNSPASPFYGRCYTEFEDPTEADLIFMTTSTDGGLTWGLLGNTADQAHGLGGQPVVQPTGKVIVPIEIFSHNQVDISSFSSADGGQTWSAPTLIAVADHHPSAGNIRNGGVLPSAQTDASGRVYVVWSDCRFENGCKANDIVLSSSAGGVTWTAPAMIPVDPVGSNVDHFTPGLGVDRTTAGGSAHLALTYYYYPQADCTVATCQLDVAFTSSTDGGRTWSAPDQLAGPMLVTWLAPTASGFMAGDYIATAVVPGTPNAFPLIAVAGAPTGTLLHENMYTAAESVTGGSLVMAPAAVRGTSPVPPSAVAHGRTF